MVVNDEIMEKKNIENIDEVSSSESLSADLTFVNKDDSISVQNPENEDVDLTPPSDLGDEFLDDWDDEFDEEFDEDDGLDEFELPEGFEENEPVVSVQNASEVKENSVPEVEDSTPVETKENSDAPVEPNGNDENPQVDGTVDPLETLEGWVTNDTDGNAEATDEAYTELENVREITSDVNSDFADLSYLANVKKRNPVEDEKDAKKRKQEEKKRKRKEENDIFARRYQAKSINAAVAQSNPIIYFYNAVLDKKGEIKLFNVYQVLQDRFVGKLVPQLWTAVAESSDRVLELNMANLVEQMKICEEFPMYEFVLTMSTRFFTKPAVLQKMLDLIEKPIPNLVMAFDCVSLQNLGAAAKTGLGQVKAKGVKIILDNTEKVSMTTLSELEFDYLRIDSRYYELGNFKSEGFLRLLLSLAQELGIPTIAMYCDHNDMVEYMLYMGIDMVQGNSISRPMRTVPNAVKAITLSDSMREDA